MSFLFPLYALAAFAIAAPILFHLFQRRPHGQQEFSSLMFLTSTPPKLTRRSRLSDWLLLLIRALALLFLALAFGRPFLRSSTLLDLNAPSRSVTMLVDTSASMRRDDVWQKLQTSVEEVISDLRPTDQVSMIAFDRKPETLVSFEAWDEASSSQRLALLRSQAKGLSPSWFATNLSAAMIAASDGLLQQRLVEDHNQPLHVVLFSDLQSGSDLELLQSYDWPEEISVDLRSITAKQSSNASAQVLPPSPGDMDASQVRVLVRNESDSKKAQLKLGWNDNPMKPIDTHVPPGQTRVVKLTQPRGARTLSVQGDDQAFDNELYVTESTPLQKKLWYIGDDEDSNINSLYFYLRKATLDTRSREVVIEKLDDMTSLATVMPKEVPLIVLSKPLRDSSLTDMQRYVNRGGRLLIVLEAAADVTATGQFLSAMLDASDVQVVHAATESGDYAMLADIEFQHKLFRPFADPRFNDFTKIRFWTHRQLSSSHENAWTNLARFDDGFPALAEKKMEAGVVYVLTSGWQPSESQLALSSKFVPLLHNVFGHEDDTNRKTAGYEVGQPIRITAVPESTTVLDPNGETHVLAAMSESFDETNQPGLYELQQGTEQYFVAVNLAAAESRTEPLLPDRLEQLGVQLGEQKSVETLANEQRQMRSKELEGRQKLWRWGILAALAAVAVETWIGGRGNRLAKSND